MWVSILYQDLRKKGVFCWYAPKSLYAGEKFPTFIVQSIQSWEKVLLVLSKHALQGDWVRKEVTLLWQKEGNGKREVLAPIHIDSAILNATNATLDWGVAIRKGDILAALRTGNDFLAIRRC